jgi:polyhydroxyalkanoate depolymerase
MSDMMYLAYQAASDWMEPLRAMAGFASRNLHRPFFGMARIPGVPDPSRGFLARNLSAAYEVLSQTRLTHERPPFGIVSTTMKFEIEGRITEREVPVREVPVEVTPFGTLLHFAKDTPIAQPRVLVVAPLSGHFATLLRGTVETLLPENDVFITDWHNGRDIPLADGVFGFDEYIDHLIRFLEVLGPGTHLVAVCQPCVAALAATAVMAQAGNPALPRSMTLMAGPIDCRINPTKVNALATGQSIEWFEDNLITRVPRRYRGAGRRVYPGFLQLTAFLAMNLERHVSAHINLIDHLAAGEAEDAAASRHFYDEYFAVLDLTAEFYLETVKRIFQDFDLPLGRLKWHGQHVEPRAIRKTALLTVEGERDDICSLGQTMAAQELCSGLRPYRKKHHMQAGVGHYGVFSGTRWNKQIYPIVRNVILSSD